MMFKRPDPERKPWVYKSPMIVVPEGADLPTIETETVIASGNNKLNTVAEIRAKRLLDRVAKGESLSHAASAERMKVSELKDPDNPIRASLQQLIGSYFLPPEARKQMVRAGLNKMFLENVSSTDANQQKIALDAAKQIAADVEVNITGNDASGNVIINIGELADVFKQLGTQEAPHVSDGRQSEDRILEADYDVLAEPGDQSGSVPDVSGGLGTGDGSEVVPSE
jgi:hypothetical protein